MSSFFRPAVTCDHHEYFTHSSFTLSIWGCGWSELTLRAIRAQEQFFPGGPGSAHVCELASSQPWTQIQSFSPSPWSTHLQKNHLQEIQILAKISWGRAGKSVCANHTEKTLTFDLFIFFCTPQTSTLAVPKEARTPSDCVQSSQSPAFESQQYWLVILQLLPRLWDGASSPLPTLLLLLDLSVLPRPLGLILLCILSHTLVLLVWLWISSTYCLPSISISCKERHCNRLLLLLLLLLHHKLPQMWQLKMTHIYYPTISGLTLGVPCGILSQDFTRMNWRYHLGSGSYCKVIDISRICFIEATGWRFHFLLPAARRYLPSLATSPHR